MPRQGRRRTSQGSLNGTQPTSHCRRPSSGPRTYTYNVPDRSTSNNPAAATPSQPRPHGMFKRLANKRVALISPSACASCASSASFSSFSTAEGHDDGPSEWNIHPVPATATEAERELPWSNDRHARAMTLRRTLALMLLDNSTNYSVCAWKRRPVSVSTSYTLPRAQSLASSKSKIAAVGPQSNYDGVSPAHLQAVPADNPGRAGPGQPGAVQVRDF